MPPADRDKKKEPDDPVVAEYDVYITEEMKEQMYLLQYLNRNPQLSFTKKHQSRPSEVRIKEKSGFVEVDVPINLQEGYNRRAGVVWGESLRKTKHHGQKAFGLAAGFKHVDPPRLRGVASEAATPDSQPGFLVGDDNLDEYIENLEDANEKGHVLSTRTYGGQIMPDHETSPSYMVGAFRGSKCNHALAHLIHTLT